jgi:hypothetical protein
MLEQGHNKIYFHRRNTCVCTLSSLPPSHSLHHFQKKKHPIQGNKTAVYLALALSINNKQRLFIHKDTAYSRENEVCSPKVRNFFHPKYQTNIYLLPGPRKRLFSRSHLEKCQRPVPLFFWIYKLNTSLVQIPTIEEYFASWTSKKIIFEVTL